MKTGPVPPRWWQVIGPALLFMLALTQSPLTSADGPPVVGGENREFVEGTATNFCPGGEDITFSGYMRSRTQITLDGTGSFHLLFTDNSQGLHGVGVISGARYQLPFRDMSTTYSSFTDFPIISTGTGMTNIVGQGPDNNLRISDVFHVTINANGDTTVLFDQFRIECDD